MADAKLAGEISEVRILFSVGGERYREDTDFPLGTMIKRRIKGLSDELGAETNTE